MDEVGIALWETRLGLLSRMKSKRTFISVSLLVFPFFCGRPESKTNDNRVKLLELWSLKAVA